MLRDYCVTSIDEAASFVGIRFCDGTPKVIFPYGYNISDNDKECRMDILRLLSILQMFTEHTDGDKFIQEKELKSLLPISSYLYIIQDYLAHGYYKENELHYVKSAKGKIDWKRTIQKEQPFSDGDNVIYLKFQAKTNQINQNNMITKIHRYCVYQSFFRLGWLFSTLNYLPPKPEILYNQNLFLRILHEALNNTFNDNKRKLFQSMINIIQETREDSNIKNCYIGVSHFEYVWERMIDCIWGDIDKQKYFPHAVWHIIKDGKFEQSNALEPDTIMKYKDKFYVLDAKYYKYGITKSVKDLPSTSSIHKQITYGKYIIQKQSLPNKNNVYNAFIMPYKSDDKEKMKFVSIGTGDWERHDANTLNYAYVLGILADTKWLMSKINNKGDSEISNLSALIEKSLYDYRKQFNQI